MLERLDFAVGSLADFTELRRRFSALPMAPKIMPSRDTGVDISSPGRKSLTLLVGEETAGVMYATEAHLMPGFGAPPHHQPTEEELWYIVDGELDVRVGTQATTVRAGAFAYIPRNTTHTFKNNRTAPARLLAWDSPAGHERAFEEMGRKAAQGIVEFPALRSMFANYGVMIHADPAQVAPNDHLTETRAQSLAAGVRTRDDFLRYREALARLPKLPSLLPGRDSAPDLSWSGTDLRLLLGSEQSAGQFNVADILLAPGNDLPTHRHELSEQCVYILGGRLDLTVGDKTQQVGAGAFAFIPRDTRLTIANRSEEPAHFVLWNTPGGQEPVYALLHKRRNWNALTDADRALLGACDFILG